MKPLTDLLALFGGWPMTLASWNETSFSWTEATAAARKLYGSSILLRVFTYLDSMNTNTSAIYVRPDWLLRHPSRLTLNGRICRSIRARCRCRAPFWSPWTTPTTPPWWRRTETTPKTSPWPSLNRWVRMFRWTPSKQTSTPRWPSKSNWPRYFQVAQVKLAVLPPSTSHLT